MGLITVPAGYIYMLLYGLFLVIIITVGSIAFTQMWTDQALKNATSAAVTQVSSDGAAQGSAQVATADAQGAANAVWNAQNQAWTPSGQPMIATFTLTAQNSNTPAGQYDSVTGSTTVPLQENAINNFINTFNHNNTANYGGSLTDTISSTLPTTLP